MSSNSDLVPFDEADVLKWRAEFASSCYDKQSSKDAAYALNAVFGGKPRPPRTHAVTVDELNELIENETYLGVFCKLQNLMGRFLDPEDYYGISEDVEKTTMDLNAKYGLTPALETDDEKWERIRREGLSDAEAEYFRSLYAESHSDPVPGLQTAFRMVLGIGEARA